MNKNYRRKEIFKMILVCLGVLAVIGWFAWIAVMAQLKENDYNRLKTEELVNQRISEILSSRGET